MTTADITHNTEAPQSDVGTNPLIALAIIIAIAIVMVIVCFIIFLKSSAYDTVKQINAGTSVASKSDLSTYDTTSPIKADELEKYSSSMSQRLNSLDDELDFGQNGLSNQALGL